MERLTEKHAKKNGGYYMKCSEYCEREETMCIECERSDEIVDRLGAIEDILGDDYDLDRLRELVEADRDGRCVMLPCKTGDPVWFKIEDTDGEYISEDRVTESGTRGFWTSGILDVPEGMHLFTEWNEIGKTVFLTREAAEAELKGDLHGEQ